jgi:3-dehydro-L-gulonate 2-dehydrogenase
MRVKYEDMLAEFERILRGRGCSPEDAYESAKIFTENSADGVNSHGVNRFMWVVSYIDKGYINVKEKAVKIDGAGAFERWDGRGGMGNLNAMHCMDRAIELARQYSVGVVAIRNNNHWMRGGYYGWQAADAGCIGICWTNTCANMPAWGAKDNRIGNNPLIIAIPRGNGEHVVADCAMAQFSFGKIEEYKLKGEQLPINGGYDSQGNLTCDPAELEKTRRTLPIGFWKGSGISICLDLAATVLSSGFSVTAGRKRFDGEYGLSQVMMAIDLSRFGCSDISDELINEVLEDIRNSEPSSPGGILRYPGERVVKAGRDSLQYGIPVDDTVWNKICRL